MQYKKCVLAYIDVLGIRNAFRNPSECDLLPFIFRLLQKVNQNRVNRYKECTGFKFKYFSDNVCIYKEVHEKSLTEGEFFNISLKYFFEKMQDIFYVTEYEDAIVTQTLHYGAIYKKKG